MKIFCYLLSSLFFYLLSPITGFAQDLSYEEKAVQAVNQIVKESHATQGREVWPGFDLADCPLIVTFGNGHVYAFNLQSQDSHWQKISIDNTPVLYSDKDYWGVCKGAMNPQFPIEGQRAYVFSLDQNSENGEKLFEILVHERFHRYQFEHFPMEKMGGHYVDDLNIENLTLMHMEEMALANFLRSKGDAKQQLEYLKDFASINQTRRLLLKNMSVLWEDHQQIMEGMAEYVSFKIFDVYPVFKPYDGNSKLKEMLDAYTRRPDITERAVKWRHYGIGAAMGYGLDFLHVKGWKKEVEKGISMAALLLKALDMSPQEMNERMAEVEVIYNYPSARQAVGQVVDGYKKAMDRLMGDYHRSEGVPVQIGRPKKSSISGGGTTAKTLYLADGTSISLRDTSMMTNRENTWKLELTEVPFVFLSRFGFREFKIEHDIQVELDGKSFLLKELMALEAPLGFETIKLKGKACKFVAEKLPGEVSFVKGVLRVHFL
jgi:hypothetical protein